MSRAWGMRVSALVVLLALAGAVGLTVYTVKQVENSRRALERRASDLDGLAAIKASLAVYERARTAFETCQTMPPPLTALVSGVLPPGLAPEMRDLSAPGPSGWNLRRHELSFDQVSIADALALVHAAGMPVRDAQGNERPGWRLAACTIRATPGQPGVGRVVMVLEALVRE